MKEIIENQIKFIGEQDGVVERELKAKLNNVFLQSSDSIRAYLVRVQYSNSTEINVTLCIKSDNDFNETLLGECSRIFESIFKRGEHLDILYITDAQERKIRELCCPFYTDNNFRITTPDFYLSSSEGYDLGDAPISCYKRKRLYGAHKEGYILCDIEPSIIGQSYGLGSQDIDQIIIANRFEGMSLFPIKEWPTYVHVARPLIQNISMKDSIEEGDSELIAWAEIKCSGAV